MKTIQSIIISYKGRIPLNWKHNKISYFCMIVLVVLASKNESLFLENIIVSQDQQALKEQLENLLDTVHLERIDQIKNHILNCNDKTRLYNLQEFISDVINDDKDVSVIKRNRNPSETPLPEPTANWKEKVLLYAGLCIITLIIWRYSPQIIELITTFISVTDLQQSIILDLTLLDWDQCKVIHDHLFKETIDL